MKRLLPVIFILLIAVSATALLVEDEDYIVSCTKNISGFNSEGYAHECYFTWKNDYQQSKDFCLFTPEPLKQSALYAWLHKTESWTEEYMIRDLDTYEANSWDCGKEYNFNVTFLNSTEKQFCFDQYSIYEGNITIYIYHNFDYYEKTNVNKNVKHIKYGNGHLYCIEKTFKPFETIRTLFRYRLEALKKFKWDAAIGDLETGTIDLRLDPFTDPNLYEADFTADTDNSYDFIKNTTTLSTREQDAGGAHYYPLDYNGTDMWGHNNISNLPGYSTKYATFATSGSGAPKSVTPGQSVSSYTFDNTTLPRGSVRGFAGSAWVHISSLAGEHVIKSRPTPVSTGDFILYINAGPPRIYLWKGTLSGSLDICDATESVGTDGWYNVIYNYDSATDTCQFLVNGTSTNATPYNGNSGTTGQYAFYTTGTTNYIDEFKLYNRSLSMQEMYNIYNYGSIYHNEQYDSKNITVNVTVGNFTPEWSGQADTVNISFDNCTHFITVENDTLYTWNRTVTGLCYHVKIENDALFSNFNITINNNTAPEITNDSYDSTVYDGEDLLAYATYNDAQGQNGTIIASWNHTGNGTAIYAANFTANDGENITVTLPNAYIEPGYAITVYMTPYDGQETGTTISHNYPTALNASGGFITCLYSNNPKLSEEQEWVCTITKVAGKNLTCHGITMSEDGYVLDVYPRPSIEEGIYKEGYEAAPSMATTQRAKIKFSNKRFYVDTTVMFKAQCVTNYGDVFTFAKNLTIEHDVYDESQQAALSTIPNVGFIIFGILAVIVILVLISAIKEAAT